MKQQAFTTLAGLRLERRRLLSARLVGGRLRRGLTLMELAIVIVVLGIIIGIIAANLDLSALDKAQILRMKTAALNLNSRWQAYEATHTSLRENDPVSRMNINNRDMTLDPWGNEYFICRDPDGRRQICSFGADGQPGGEDRDEDIYLTREDLWPAWLRDEVAEAEEN
ncbi:MAG: type II secretion system protein GspG [Spirochaetales bacterium]|nr:type II secretion system protein GspG [Phycisphaerales bacterium]MCB1326091.1 type II secretion system protein GspG [Leptospiraceae bacterium]MCP5483780.1 type II secretion system protein GspG [Spirochaetales bacterium]